MTGIIDEKLAQKVAERKATRPKKRTRRTKAQIEADKAAKNTKEKPQEAPVSNDQPTTLTTLQETEETSQNASESVLEAPPAEDMVEVLVKDVRIAKVFELYNKIVASGGSIKPGTAPRVIGSKQIRCMVPKDKVDTWKDTNVLPVLGATYTLYYLRFPTITKAIQKMTEEMQKGAILNPKRPSMDNGMYTIFMLSEKPVDKSPGVHILQTVEWGK